MNEEQFAELAAGYALDALSPEDRSAFETARAQHPEWERLVMADAAAAATLADGVARVEPPPAVREALLARIAVTAQEAAAEHPPLQANAAAGEPRTEVIAGASVAPTEMVTAPGEPPGAVTGATEPVDAPAEPPPNTDTIQAISRRRWTRGMLGLAASLVLLVGLGFGAVSIGQLLDRPAAVVALEQIENAPDAKSASAEVDDGGNATVHWSESVGKVVLVSSGLPSIEADQSFELWYVRDGTPLPAGTFEDPTEATVLLEGTMKPGDVIAVTVEPQGGSPTGEPTSDPIVAIPTAA